MLESARLRTPAEPQLWLEAVRLERQAGNHAAAPALLAKALQHCPASGVLWAEAIGMEPRQTQKAKSSDALKRCEDAHVILAVSRLFWRDRKVSAPPSERAPPSARASRPFEPSPTQRAHAAGCAALFSTSPPSHDRPPSRRARMPRLPTRALPRCSLLPRQIDKARSWCNRAAALEPRLGDAWGNYLAFEMEHGTAEQQADVLARAVAAAPEYGERWKRLTDDPANHSVSVSDFVKRVAAEMKLS
jgi:pre-mRNA-processing factor 6